MWTQDTYPGADKIPWQLLIRARFVDEIDVVVAHLVVDALARFMTKDRARQLAGAAAKAVMFDGSERVEVGVEQRMAILRAFADWDGEYCPLRWPWPWPWPPRARLYGEFDDPAIMFAIDPIQTFMKGAGSQRLAEAVGEAVGPGLFGK